MTLLQSLASLKLLTCCGLDFGDPQQWHIAPQPLRIEWDRLPVPNLSTKIWQLLPYPKDEWCLVCLHKNVVFGAEFLSMAFVVNSLLQDLFLCFAKVNNSFGMYESIILLETSYFLVSLLEKLPHFSGPPNLPFIRIFWKHASVWQDWGGGSHSLGQEESRCDFWPKLPGDWQRMTERNSARCEWTRHVDLRTHRVWQCWSGQQRDILTWSSGDLGWHDLRKQTGVGRGECNRRGCSGIWKTRAISDSSVQWSNTQELHILSTCGTSHLATAHSHAATVTAWGAWEWGAQ